MTNLLIDNRDTLAHIDTYQMLTGESWQESEIDYQREQLNNAALDYDSFNWEYDHTAIVQDFARHSLNYVIDMMREYTGIKDIHAELKASESPKFYNYTSDSYTFELQVSNELAAFMAAHYVAHKDAINDRLEKYSDRANWQHATVCDIIDRAITKDASGLECDIDDYNMTLWELEWEVYSNNTTVTPV